MKGRLFVVNEETLANTLNENIVSVKIPNLDGAMWFKTITDIMADMLQVEVGDYIFLWETSSNSRKSRIHGVYRAMSKPYYLDTGDGFPFKIHIECAYSFENPITEYDVLNCPYVKESFWSIIGKKVAGKSRGSTPLYTNEIKNLITLLIGKSQNYQYTPFDPNNIVNVNEPLTINYSNRGLNIAPQTHSELVPNNLNFIRDDYSLQYEKILEAMLNYEMANNNIDLFLQLGIDSNKVMWYSNYLPYSIEQSEMDYVIIESDDGVIPSKIYVVELQINNVDEDHINRCLMYSKWVSDTLSLGAKIVQPMIICKKSPDFINGERTEHQIQRMTRMNDYISENEIYYNSKDLQIFTYNITNNGLEFIRKR